MENLEKAKKKHYFTMKNVSANCKEPETGEGVGVFREWLTDYLSNDEMLCRTRSSLICQ